MEKHLRLKKTLVGNTLLRSEGPHSFLPPPLSLEGELDLGGEW